ncbi:MAG TPA: hypothetical protein VN688_34885 [Gemmataceae bacterium]|nr:hypothetical protein [Gemmataceae bacterium]
MKPELKPGDRVRLTTRNCVPVYYPGDKGTVTNGPKCHLGAEDPYYLVTMDKDGGDSETVFNVEDIEPDV